VLTLYCNADHLDRIDTGRIPGSMSDLSAATALGRTTWADIVDHAAEVGP
jgi:hypothetical protein